MLFYIFHWRKKVSQDTKNKRSDVLSELCAASADTISLCTTLEDLLSDLLAVSALLSLTPVLFVGCRCDRKWHKST